MAEFPGLGHVAVTVTDLDRSREWYSKLFDAAPVLDVDTNPDNPIIADRSFGPDVSLVSRMGVALINGLQESGVAACGNIGDDVPDGISAEDHEAGMTSSLDNLAGYVES